MIPWEIAPVPFVAGACLLACRKWKTEAWPAALAVGLAYLYGHVAVNGLPAWRPLETYPWIFHAAAGVTLLALAPARRWVEHGVRLVASLAVAWLFLRTLRETQGSLLWYGATGAALFLLWTVLDARARAVRGAAAPAALMVAAAGLSVALLLARSARLSLMAAALAAAFGAPFALGLFAKDQRFERAVGPAAAVMLGLFLCAYFRVEDFPLWSVVLLAAAPVLVERRWWLTLVLALIPAAIAAYLAHAAQPPPDPYGY